MSITEILQEQLLFINQHRGLATGLGLIFGAIFGSFLNVLTLRWPGNAARKWREEALSFLGLPTDWQGGKPALVDTYAGGTPGINEPSRCPRCGARIRWRDNVPILGWLLLMGKARCCGARISPQYLLIEVLAAGWCGWLTWHGGWHAWTLAGVMLGLTLLPAALIDLRLMLLPDEMVYATLWCGMIFSALGVPGMPAPVDAITAVVAAWVGLWAFGEAYKLVRNKEGMGQGDFKLLAALGAWVGLGGLLPVVFLAAFIGLAGAGIVAIRGKDATAPMPFGPSLAIAGVIQWLDGGWSHTLLMWLAHIVR